MTLGINSSRQQQRGKENYTIGVCNHRWSVLRLRCTKQHPLRCGNNFILCDMIFRFLKFMLVWIFKIMNQIFYDLSTTWYAIFTFFCASFPISLCYLRICQFSLTTLNSPRDLSTSNANENNMAAGGNVEVVWKTLMNYLIPDSTQAPGINEIMMKSVYFHLTN